MMMMMMMTINNLPRPNFWPNQQHQTNETHTKHSTLDRTENEKRTQFWDAYWHRAALRPNWAARYGHRSASTRRSHRVPFSPRLSCTICPICVSICRPSNAPRAPSQRCHRRRRPLRRQPRLVAAAASAVPQPEPEERSPQRAIITSSTCASLRYPIWTVATATVRTAAEENRAATWTWRCWWWWWPTQMMNVTVGRRVHVEFTFILCAFVV